MENTEILKKHIAFLEKKKEALQGYISEIQHQINELTEKVLPPLESNTSNNNNNTPSVKDSTKKRPRTHIIIDCGHGGIHPETKDYVTRPSKMYRFANMNDFHFGGDEFFEGVFNREVGKTLADMLHNAEIPYTFVNHEWEDNSLSDRVVKANRYNRDLQQKGDTSIYVSIHGNASTSPNAKGFSVFISPRASIASQKLATFLGTEIIKDIPKMQFRREYQDAKYWRAKFFVLQRTQMPAILSENGFFTNYTEAKKMMTEEFIHQIAQQHFDMCIYAQKQLWEDLAK